MTDRSIYTDFVEYQDADVTKVTSKDDVDLYAIDTNILVNLYKLTAPQLEAALTCLEVMSDRLFVPHQTLVEFWPLATTAAKQGTTHNELVSNLRDARKKASTAFNRWLEVTGLEPWTSKDALRTDESVPSDDTRRLRAEMSAIWSAVDAMEERVKAIQEDAEKIQERILPTLERILAGHVGAPVDDATHAQRVQSFKKRSVELIPPGFEDRDKPGDKGAGDYLIWEECLDEVRRRAGAETGPVDLVLVTEDLKDDWVREARQGDRESYEERGHVLAHRGLVKEYADASGGGVLRVMTLKQLMQVAKELYGAKISDDVLGEIARRVEPETQAEESSAQWTVEALQRYIDILRERGAEDQIDVLLAIWITEVDWNVYLNFSAAQELVGRKNMQGFATPYGTAGGQLASELGEPFGPLVSRNWSGAPARWVYDFTSPVAAELGPVISRDPDLKERADMLKVRLTEFGVRPADDAEEN